MRHAGDVARGLERRHGGAVHDAHGVELMAAGRRDDAAASGSADGVRLCAAAAPSAAASARAACRRSTGTTSDSRACRAPASRRSAEHRRLARLDRDAVEHDLAARAMARRGSDRARRPSCRRRTRARSSTPRVDRRGQIVASVSARGRWGPTGTPPCAAMIAASVKRLMS